MRKNLPEFIYLIAFLNVTCQNSIVNAQLPNGKLMAGSHSYSLPCKLAITGINKDDSPGASFGNNGKNVAVGKCIEYPAFITLLADSKLLVAVATSEHCLMVYPFNTAGIRDAGFGTDDKTEIPVTAGPQFGSARFQRAMEKFWSGGWIMNSD